MALPPARVRGGGSDLKERLVHLRRITNKQKPSIKASWTRKLLSRCVSYESDFELFSLLYDMALASQISGVVAMADKNKIAPEEAASNMQNFDSYWLKEQEKLEDICRQHKQQARQQHASTARAEEDEIRERAQR